MKNWKTTLFGLMAGAAQIAAASVTTPGMSGGSWQTKDWVMAASGIFMALTGVLAKDAGVTGTEK